MHQASLGALRLYSLGLRLQETINLQVGDIDKDRRVVHIRNDKGGRDRVVPLPAVTLRGLRAYYRTHRQGKEAGTIDKTVSSNGVQDALRRTVKKLGIKKHVHPHVFRHSYATHLLEANVPIHHVQELLGHKDLKSNK
jgi:site-specific recombinase XerD